jgi:hypothetical protein
VGAQLDSAIYPGRPELCDGRGNDCNGETDEPFTQLGQACDGDDADLCTNGVWVCADLEALVCSDDATSSEEVCEGDDE